MIQYIAYGVFVAFVIVVSIAIRVLAKRISQLSDSLTSMVASLSMEVNRIKDNNEPQKVEQRMTTEIAEKIEKKWDDALHQIFDYDPFGGDK